jgi:hypothetical protein
MSKLIDRLQASIKVEASNYVDTNLDGLIFEKKDKQFIQRLCQLALWLDASTVTSDAAHDLMSTKKRPAKDVLYDLGIVLGNVPKFLISRGKEALANAKDQLINFEE